MNFRYFKNILPVAAIALTAGLSSCVGDLDVTPIDPSTVMTPSEPELYTKCYANMALAGQGGANGDCDIDGLDGGTTGFVRQLFNANELTTDEAICAWGDTGIPAFNYNQWDASHPMLKGFYYRLYAGITYCNHYLDVCKGINETREAEVRFLRCLYYSYLMDCWGNVPFALALSSESPHVISRADLFNWIEAEILGKEITVNALDNKDIVLATTTTDGILAKLLPSKVRTEGQDEYGRADQDAARLLLARLYLNAEVYTGKARWADAKKYAQEIMNGQHKLWTSSKNGWSAYQMLFMGDNGTNGASQEAILPLIQDGKTSTSWGTTLFLMASTWKADMDVDVNYNTTEFWAGNRARSQFIAKFFPNGDAPQVAISDMAKAAGDDRALFHGADRELVVTKPAEYTSGYAVGKFRNSYTDGSQGHSSQFIDTDYFLMRSAEAYLILAEADARLNNGTTSSEGTAAIDAIRSRANASVAVAAHSYTLAQILDERARELYYEGFRRTDLIRNGLFNTADYLWDWKGGSQNGSSFSANLNVFAIPDDDMLTNPNLKGLQNPGY